MKHSVKNLFFYSGLEPEQYNLVENELQAENIKILSTMSPIAAIIFIALIIGAFFNPTMMTRIGLYTTGAAIEIIIYCISKLQKKNNAILTLGMVHTFNLTLYSFGFLMDLVSRYNLPAVSFCVILVLCQLVFNVRPIQSGSISFVVMVSFLLIAFRVKPEVAFLDDILNVTCFWGAGLALNVMLSNMRAKRHWIALEQMKQSEKLADALKAADDANQAKTTFLFNMSHDIRTPMNAIIGYTNLIDAMLTDEQIHLKHYIDNIKISSNYMLNLLDNVLEMSRMESGKMALNLEPCDIRKFLDSISVIFAEDINKKKLSIDYSCDVTNQYLFIDTVKMREMILNILGNSVKYTQNGGKISMHIKEMPCSRQGYAKLQAEFTDNGMGMSEEYLPHIFEPFSRESSASKNKIPGTGLGMGIVKKLVDLMEGTISVESEKEKGTTIYVELLHPIAQLSDIQVNSKSFENKKDSRSLEGYCILLAEDNDLNAEIAMEVLEAEGLKVERVVDGEECVNTLLKAENGHFDLVLMDIQMPNIDGYAAAKMIRKMFDVSKKNIPILAMTANAFPQDKQNALDAGMNGYITKPFDVDTFMETIKNTILSR